MAKIACPQCNTQALDDTSFFCYRCGMRLSDNIPVMKNAGMLNTGMKLVKKETMNARDDVLVSWKQKPGPMKRINTIEICAHCGAPVLDTSSVFCNECAANVQDNPSGGQFPILQPYVLEKKPVAAPEIRQHTKHQEVTSQDSFLIRGTRAVHLKGSRWKLVIVISGLIIVVIMLLLIAMFMFTFWVSLY